MSVPSFQMASWKKKVDDLSKAVKAVTRKSRFYDTEARTGITETDCSKLAETQETKNTYENKETTPKGP